MEYPSTTSFPGVGGNKAASNKIQQCVTCPISVDQDWHIKVLFFFLFFSSNWSLIALYEKKKKKIIMETERGRKIDAGCWWANKLRCCWLLEFQQHASIGKSQGAHSYAVILASTQEEWGWLVEDRYVGSNRGSFMVAIVQKELFLFLFFSGSHHKIEQIVSHHNQKKAAKKKG